MDQEKTQNKIKEIISKMPLQADEISFTSSNTDQVLWCQIKTKEPHFFIGRDGDILSAFNHLVRKIVEKSFFDENPSFNKGDMKIIIDVNDYQKKKIENLKTTAHMLSERAQFFKNNIETDSLSASDRKIIHEFLAGRPNIQTESVGIEPRRRVMIKYVEQA